MVDRSLIGRTWAEWEESVGGLGDDLAEEEYLAYRRTVAKETPLLMLEADVKSECGGGYETELVKCEKCNIAFKICHLRTHVLQRHPDIEVNTSSVIKTEPGQRKTNVASIIVNNNGLVKKRSQSPGAVAGSSGVEPAKRVKKEPTSKDETKSIFFARRENPVVIFGECDDDSDLDSADEHHQRSYLNHFIKPLAYPRYGCYVDKGAKMHTYSSASRHLNQKLQLLQSNAILPGMEPTEFEGSSPMTPLSQPSPNLPPKLNKLAHVRVQH